MSEEIKKLGAEIKTTVDGLQEKIKSYEATETEVKEANEKLEKMRSDFSALVKKQEESETALKKQIAEAAKKRQEQETKTFADHVRKGLIENEDKLKSFAEGASKGMNFHVKSPITMTFGDSTTGDPSKQMRPGIVMEASRQNHIRELIGSAPLAAEVWEVPKEKNQEGGAGNTAEGNDKSAFSSEIVVEKFNVETIAAITRVSRRMLRNIDALTQYLNSRLPNLVLNQEDVQLLTGNGSTPNLVGIAENAVAHGDIDYGADVVDAQNWDVLASVFGYQMSQNFDVNGVVVNPIDFFDMLKAKGNDGQYVSPLIFVGGRAILYGVEVFKNTAVTKGQYFLGDWTQSELLINEALNVRFFEEDRDNVQKNLITVRAEEDVLHAIYQEKAYVNASFADGIAAISAS